MLLAQVMIPLSAAAAVLFALWFILDTLRRDQGSERARAFGGAVQQSLGALARRQFARRMTTYLILRTTANLTPATNPDDPELWCEEMQATDLENWTSEGLAGGAEGHATKGSSIFENQQGRGLFVIEEA